MGSAEELEYGISEIVRRQGARYSGVRPWIKSSLIEYSDENFAPRQVTVLANVGDYGRKQKPLTFPCFWYILYPNGQCRCNFIVHSLKVHCMIILFFTRGEFYYETNWAFGPFTCKDKFFQGGNLRNPYV